MPHHRFLLIIYPAQGHINPTLQFAKRLISSGAEHVTLCTTLHTYRRISNKPTLPNLTLLPFSDGFDDGFKLTPDTDYSLYATELKRRGTEFVTDLILSAAQEGKPFTCLIYTLLLHWAAEAARGLHLPTALLWIQPATVLDIIFYYFHGYHDCLLSKIEFQLPGLPFSLSPSDLPSFLLPSNDSFIVSYFEEQFRELDVEANPTILVNSFEALEPEAMRAVGDFNVIPIGPLIPSAFLDGKDPNDTSFGGDIFRLSNGCAEWLDLQAEKSVVYVSFGSFVVLSKTQMEEIARALLDCGHPFLWVIREMEEELSCRDELEEKGKVVAWCCQVEVLSHRSVGCFLTHCGWNSTMESLVSGVPMVAFPRFSDQMTNAKMVEDVWKIGVRMDHCMNEDGVVEGEEIRKCLDAVMGNGEKAEEVRRNAEKFKGLAMEAGKEGGSSEKNLMAFLAVGCWQFKINCLVGRNAMTGKYVTQNYFLLKR